MRRSIGAIGLASMLLAVGNGLDRAEAGDPGIEGEKGLVAHEWGSAVFVQAADGAIAGGVEESVPLPGFVLRWPEGVPRMAIAVRKPVLYLYAERPVRIAVDVGIPEGIFTEWWPQADAVAPARGAEPLKGGSVSWRTVSLFPGKAPYDAREVPAEDPFAGLRRTDAAWLTVSPGVDLRNPGRVAGQRIDCERFLLYRGACDAASAATVRLLDGGKGGRTLRNTGGKGISSALVVEVKEGAGTITEAGPLAGGAEVALRAGRPLLREELRREGRKKLKALLLSGGLFEKETEGMLGYWEEEWLGWEGTRVLYLLPEEEVERLLPLKIAPRPERIVRVMAACMEVLTPERSARIEASVAALGAMETERREKAHASLKDLGRLAEPFLRKALDHEDLEIRTRARALLDGIGAGLHPAAPERREAFLIDGNVWLKMPAPVAEALCVPAQDPSAAVLTVNGKPVFLSGEKIKTISGIYFRIDAKRQASEWWFGDDKILPGKIALTAGEKTGQVQASGREYLCIELEGKAPARIEIGIPGQEKRYILDLKPGGERMGPGGRGALK